MLRDVRSGHPMQFPALIVATQFDLTVYPHTAGIYLMAFSAEGRLYMMLAWRKTRLVFLDSLRGCQSLFVG